MTSATSKLPEWPQGSNDPRLGDAPDAYERALRQAWEARARLAVPKLKQWAGECAECGGKGYTYDGEGVTGRWPDDVIPNMIACDQCEDIREVIHAIGPLPEVAQL